MQKVSRPSSRQYPYKSTVYHLRVFPTRLCTAQGIQKQKFDCNTEDECKVSESGFGQQTDPNYRCPNFTHESEVTSGHVSMYCFLYIHVMIIIMSLLRWLDSVSNMTMWRDENGESWMKNDYYNRTTTMGTKYVGPLPS